MQFQFVKQDEMTALNQKAFTFKGKILNQMNNLSDNGDNLVLYHRLNEFIDSNFEYLFSKYKRSEDIKSSMNVTKIYLLSKQGLTHVLQNGPMTENQSERYVFRQKLLNYINKRLVKRRNSKRHQ